MVYTKNLFFFFFSSRRRHTRFDCDWSSDVCSSDLSVKPRNDLSDKGRAVEEWLDLRFFRPIGIRIARALYSTGISPDQVTLWSLLVGLVAGRLFVYQDRWIHVIGFVLFIVADVFDSADCQLARLRGTSKIGRAHV